MRARAKIRALERENQKLREIVARLQEEVEHLKGIVQELQEQLRTNSRNSSKPPSSDPPSNNPPSCFDGGRDGKHKPEGRSPACREPPGRARGQPGHEPKTRKLLPPDQVDQVVNCKAPERCECGGSARLTDVEPERRQTLDIPPIKPVVTEYRLFAGLCEACGRRRRGALPDGVGSGLLCPRPMAMAALLSGKYHLSKRNVVQLLEDLMGTELCLGTVSNIEARVSGSIEQAVEEARRFVAQTELRDSERTRQRIRRTHAHRMRKVQAPGAQRSGISRASHRGNPAWTSRPIPSSPQKPPAKKSPRPD